MKLSTIHTINSTMNQSFGRAMSFVVSTLLLGAFVIFAQSKRQQTLVVRGGSTTTSTSISNSSTTSSTSNTSATISNHTQTTKHGNSMCLNKNEFKRNIDHHEQIFVVMPPKAGGSSLTIFAKSCYGEAAVYQDELHTPNLRKKWLTQSYDDTPNLHIGHVLTENGMKYLLKGAPKDSLIVYIHREESSRLASAIKQVMEVFCRGAPGRDAVRKFEFVQRNETDHTCTIAENDLVEKVILPKVFEIFNSVYDIWSCDTFHTLNDNRPNLVTMNMNQIDALQTILAEKFCPHMANKPLHSNIASQKVFKNFVQLSSNSTRIVSLNEWISKKKNMIEYSLDFKDNIGCQKNVRDMEDELFETCSNDGFLKFSTGRS